MLDELELGFAVEHESLVVTSRDDWRPFSVVYSLGDLVADADPPAALQHLVRNFVWPDAWAEAGGPCTLHSLPGAFVVCGGAAMHERLARFFDHLRRALDPKVASYDPFNRSPAEARLDRALGLEVSLEANESPLADVLARLSEQVGVPLEASAKKLEEANVTLDTPVTCSIRRLPLRAALKTILRELGLNYVMHDEIILVTSGEGEENRVVTGVYRLGQLTAAPQGIEGPHLCDIFRHYVRPPSWVDAGGWGEVKPFRNVVLIETTREIHEGCQELLAALTRFHQGDHAQDITLWETPGERRLRELLRRPAAVESPTGMASDLVAALRRAHPECPIELRDGDPPWRHPSPLRRVAVSLHRQTLADALTTVCRQLRHGWFVGPDVDLEWIMDQDRVRLLASPASAASGVTTRLFRVDSERFGPALAPDRLPDLLMDHAPPAWGFVNWAAIADRVRADRVPGGLVVAAPQPAERHIRRFLDQLRHALDRAWPLPRESQDPPHHTALEDALIRGRRWIARTPASSRSSNCWKASTASPSWRTRCGCTAGWAGRASPPMTSASRAGRPACRWRSCWTRSCRRWRSSGTITTAASC